MKWLKRLIGGEQKAGKPTPPSYKSKAVIKILNSYGHYDSSPLLVEKSPDVEKIFKDSNPPVIQQLSDRNRDYWSSASVGDRRMTLYIGYLQHPNPEVRKAVMVFLPHDMPARVAQVLTD